MLVVCCCGRVSSESASPWPSWRAAVALLRRFGRVCWDRAALRRGADRRVPLPIRIAGPTGNSCHAIAGRDPHDVERLLLLSHASQESSHRPLGARTNDDVLITWKLAVANGSTDAVPFRRRCRIDCIRAEFHCRCRIDAESTVRIARHRSLVEACHCHEVGQPPMALLPGGSRDRPPAQAPIDGGAEAPPPAVRRG